MNTRMLPRAIATGIALALGCALAHAATPPQTPPMPDVATDPAGAWAWMYEHADYTKLWPAYDVLEKVNYTNTSADADACRANAQALKDAVALAPVSIVIRRAVMLCAEATGDEAGAEEALKPLAALSKYALAGVTDNNHGAVVRVLRHNDVYALVATMGLEWRYEYYEALRPERTFPFVVAAWNPQTKVERHLRFDWVDAVARMVRDPAARYPIVRTEVANEGVNANAKGNIAAAVDFNAWKDARTIAELPDKVAKLREGALAGGTMSPVMWLATCAREKAAPHCADGLVDALLPAAEEQHSVPMALLAYAYNEGVGIARDPAQGKRLLDAADQRVERKDATVNYAGLWRAVNDGPMPPDLRARVEAAAAVNNEAAKYMLFLDNQERDPKARPTAADIAMLSSKAQNGDGNGFKELADDADEHGEKDKAFDYWRRAAEAGDAASQGQLASHYLFADDLAQRDDAAAEKWLVRAAEGGEKWSARMLATRAEKRGDYAAAFQWLREPLDNDDVDAALRIADLFLEERPGLTKKREDGLKLLSNLADFGIGAASRRLAELSIEGKLVPKDLKNARRVLTASAERSDVESQSMLGYHLLTGTFGKVDEREGQKWLERALAEEDVGAAVTYTQWLFWTKKTPEARKHAIDLWKQSEAWSGGGDTILNNYAWALCTVDDAAWRNGAEGLVAALKMDSTSFGDIDTVAACHAAAGDFASAKVQQQKAIDLYAAYLAQEEKLRAGQALDAELKKGRDAQMDELKSRLTLYAAGKDYRTNEG